MSAPKFTPGPWVAHPSTAYRGDIGMAWDVATHEAIWDPNDFDEDEDSLGVWQEPYGYTRVARTSDMGPTAKANAHLIAAAPEMYEACRTLATYYMGHESAGDMAAKEAGSGVYQALVLARAALSKAGGA